MIRRDYAAYLAQLRRRYPNVSEAGIQAMALRGLELRPPRLEGRVKALFGRDVLSADPTTLPAWPALTATQRQTILHPEWFQHELKGIGREALLDPPGLSRTYVWSAAAGWVQEVEAADAAIILASKIRGHFQNVDEAGLFVPQRAWDLPVLETFTTSSVAELKAWERDQQGRRLWSGA